MVADVLRLYATQNESVAAQLGIRLQLTSDKALLCDSGPDKTLIQTSSRALSTCQISTRKIKIVEAIEVPSIQNKSR
jgi:hypothetical protein